ncbi:TIGR01457 family HAD-type hydrolase [Thalassorhabdus alkalitolerans]|uniref:TIGR01457 family HAD-type hydrolase n=1 Tax=Thalassorhabdus alkalitolerans TaxID=2282697 RepID=A0ABW0YL86_9BACI|nr:TIGR01457 family HAD-type hydrolase [Thalassobacillus sp. C254]
MTAYKGYLIDLDGTVYRGKEIIPEAVEFVSSLKEQNLPYLFVTNNSSETPESVAQKLQNMGIPCETKHVFTSSMATASYLTEQREKQSAYVIGEDGIQKALEQAGITYEEDQPGFVVMGIDRSITYEKLAKAALAVRNGARFIATNKDVSLPSERGLLPGNGSFVSVISLSTGVEPTVIGKPESIIVEQALERINLSKEEVLMVGDNYDTDILAGINGGIDTLMVHTGVTTAEQLKEKQEQPTHVVSSLKEWKI